MADRTDVVVNTITPADVFRKAFCICVGERPPILLDVREAKLYKKEHCQNAFNVIVSKNGKARIKYQIIIT